MGERVVVTGGAGFIGSHLADALVARGDDVYIAYDHLTGRGVWVAASHDRGASFSSVKIDPGINLGVSLAGGGTIDPAGNVYFSWVGYERHGQAKGPGRSPSAS